MRRISFVLNGEPVSCEIEGDEILTDTIRNRFKLTGTKKGCGTGCQVMYHAHRND